MKKEITRLVKKTAKVAGITCIAAGAVAIMTSKTAVQTIVKGGEYLKDAVKKILNDEPQADETEAHEEAPAAAEADFAAEETAAAEEAPVEVEVPVVEEAPAGEENT